MYLLHADVSPLDDFAHIELDLGSPASFNPANAFLKPLLWFGEGDEPDTFTRLAIPIVRAASTPCAVFHRHYFFFYKYLAIFPAVSMYPQQKRAYSALHP